MFSNRLYSFFLSELQFVDFATVSDTMFDILEANKTGRPEFDNMNSTTTSTVLARLYMNNQ